MALLRKIVSVGNSKAVVIPQSYLDYWRLKGLEMKKVKLEVNDQIIISPVFEEITRKTNIRGGE